MRGGAQAPDALLGRTLSNLLQIAPQKGVYASDIDAETERLYPGHLAPERALQARARPEAVG
jgi:hypothetical protein